MSTTHKLLVFTAVIEILFLISFKVQASSQGRIEQGAVHGFSLEHNLLGDDPDRHMTVYLPPSYDADQDRRYPVIYILHGYGSSDRRWFGDGEKSIHLNAIVDTAIAAAAIPEIIIVAPDASNRLGGSFYSSSTTTGDWEAFIAHDLVAYVDAHYRTIAQAASRGLAGHSMGGYGALRIASRHPDIFGSVYALSPCCIAPEAYLAIADNRDFAEDAERIQGFRTMAAQATPIHTFNALAEAGPALRTIFALAAAWSPDPTRPPFYLDLPFTPTGADRTIAAQWAANTLLATLDQYAPNLKRLRAIGFEAGAQDEYKSIPQSLVILDRKLATYGIDHDYEAFDGTHENRLAERIQNKALPFFAQYLSFGQ